MAYQPKMEKDIRSPLEYGMEIFGGKWKTRIICVLSEKQPLRFNELKRELINITDTVLNSTLKELISFGIVERHSYNEQPPRVDYRLTPKGETAIPVLAGIAEWVESFCGECHKEENK